jgi:hypothetical protein
MTVTKTLAMASLMADHGLKEVVVVHSQSELSAVISSEDEKTKTSRIMMSKESRGSGQSYNAPDA